MLCRGPCCGVHRIHSHHPTALLLMYDALGAWKVVTTKCDSVIGLCTVTVPMLCCRHWCYLQLPLNYNLGKGKPAIRSQPPLSPVPSQPAPRTEQRMTPSPGIDYPVLCQQLRGCCNQQAAHHAPCEHRLHASHGAPSVGQGTCSMHRPPTCAIAAAAASCTSAAAMPCRSSHPAWLLPPLLSAGVLGRRFHRCDQRRVCAWLLGVFSRCSACPPQCPSW